jgi:hypothetical protein
MANPVTDWKEASKDKPPEWMGLGKGLYVCKNGTIWIALTPEQIAMLRGQSESNLGHNYLRPMFIKGHAKVLDDGAIVVRIAGIENLW